MAEKKKTKRSLAPVADRLLPQGVVDARARDEAACNIYLKQIIDDCERSVSEGNMLAICRMHYVLKELSAQQGRLWNALQETCPDLPAHLQAKIVAWKQALKKDDKLDVFVFFEQKWYEGVVYSTSTDEAGLKVEIKFKHYKENFNETYNVNDTEIVFPETWTRRQTRTFIEESFLADPEGTTAKPAAKVPEETVWLPGYGYVPASDAEAYLLKNKRRDRGESRAAAVAAAAVPGADAGEGQESAAKAGRSSKAGRASKKRVFVDPVSGKEVEEDDNDWFCSECSLMESRDGSDLLLCDGPCLHSWHQGCLSGLNLKKIRSEGGDWLCHDCTVHEHACFVCKQRGADGAPGGVWKCKLAECGKYFHEACLETGNFLPVKVRREPPGQSSSGLAGAAAAGALSFTCPRHMCDTCYPFYGATRSAGIVTCLQCPRGFHDQCIVPGSRFNEIYLLCPLHPSDMLPSLDKIGGSDDVDYSSPESQMFERMTLPPSSAPPSVHDHAASGHFRLPIQFKEDISSGDPVFKRIKRLDYDALPAKVDSLPFHPPEECCTCKGHCSSNCLNRISKIECCGPINGELVCRACAPPSNDNEKQKGDEGWTKVNCGNRCFQNCEYAQMERFREHAMGWGMRAAENISTGRLVIEYVGEVIDEAAMRSRMLEQRKYSPSDHDFYIMEIDNGFYVDGKFKANESRFINHSCDPNCELERYNVKGRMRIGIFAIKDIKKGEALSYDYQFDTMEAEQFKCYCGADSCRGTMAPKKKGNKGSLSNAERKRLVALGRAKERRAACKDKDGTASRELELRRSYTGRFLPGDSVHRVAEGPLRPTFQFGRQSRLFLPRATKRSAHFRVRGMALKRRAAAKVRTRARGKV